MEIRLLEGTERFEAWRVSGICFHERVEDPESEREACEKSHDEDWGALTDDGKVIARIVNNHYTVRLRGKEVLMGGIGAVSTLPEYRENGSIRKIFEKLLPAARERGEVISALYPFSHVFYRKLGYETVGNVNRYSFSPELFRAFPLKLEVRQWRKGDDPEPYRKVYEAFIRKQELAVVRDRKAMEQVHIHGDEFKDRHFCYLFLKAGEAKAYLVFNDVRQEPAALMDICEAAWTDREGFAGLLAFIGRFNADYGTVSLPLPTGIDLRGLVSEPYDLLVKCPSDYMVRVIHTEKALDLLSPGEGKSFTVRITGDREIPQNNGVFTVGWDGVRRTENVTYDLSLSIQAFSQLLTGYSDLETIELREDVEIYSNRPLLEEIFTRRSLYAGDHF